MPFVRSLASRGHPLHVVSEQRARLDAESRWPEFEQRVAQHVEGPLRRSRMRVLQINLGRMCNQTCRHCHVDAGPDRTEIMSRETLLHCLRALDLGGFEVVDVTGGAPEMNPHFRWLVEQVRARGVRLMDRCNLTILTVGAFRTLPEFFAQHAVHVVASLPYFQSDRTNAQRGDGAFEASIEALRKLNSLGYGEPDSGLPLDLVYNPTGAFLPPPQKAIEADFREELRRRFGVTFSSLYTITNMPINRFLEYLIESGNFHTYMDKLVAAFNPAVVEGLMCRETLSVGWDGRLYDCDFNQMLDLAPPDGVIRHIAEFEPARFERAPIRVGRHCFGCTAGGGSSCGGALS